MNQNLTEIAMVVDCSGSMSDCIDETRKMLQSFLDEQKKVPGKLNVTYVTFNTEYRIIHSGVNIQKLESLPVTAGGFTALYDAVGKTIDDIGNRLSNTKEEDRPSKVLIVILTDGAENSSREYGFEKLKNMIAHQKQKYNWQFMFMGADFTAAQGVELGISAENSYTYGKMKSGKNMDFLNRKMSNYRCTGSAGVLNMTDEERSELA